MTVFNRFVRIAGSRRKQQVVSRGWIYQVIYGYESSGDNWENDWDEYEDFGDDESAARARFWFLKENRPKGANFVKFDECDGERQWNTYPHWYDEPWRTD